MKQLRQNGCHALWTKKLHTLLILSFALALFSCSKEGTPAPAAVTSLKITVKEGFLPLSGATVRLYLSQEDLLNATGQVGSTKITDAKGEVTFTDLSPLKYYWKVDAGCKSNINSEVTSTAALSRGLTNTATVQVAPTGTLRVVNNTSNPYDVYANGILVIDDLPGGTSRSLLSAPTGNWNIRVVQQSGYLFSPTERTFTGTLLCGATLTATIP
ncbi:SpaA isopeptide-forming pilin-related protein [Paracnuella aquatica]|uniref:SpaA isopeptide-forming pilin-related protein n=1 Tax=Paracnuella aquatica TaxID=2268757 RepID=UPI000F4FCCE1|nr:SpaA isopeptide-forming pilin-related protein [Paracnuella aquatica]RPD43496.1 hypothetical protein DRJ53_19840 [Paracnuella aquatica]